MVSDGELGGDDLSDTPSSTAAAPPSKSPALVKKKQHPTYKGSLDLPFLSSLGVELPLFLGSGCIVPSIKCARPMKRLK